MLVTVAEDEDLVVEEAVLEGRDVAVELQFPHLGWLYMKLQLRPMTGECYI